jgi:23S rRNA pseudouridine955/2504/2580 synthase
MIKILYEDQDLLLINKPPGLPSHGTLDPARPSLISELQKQIKQKLFLHHRLDRDTSGIVLLSKSKRANRPLTEIFRKHQVQKTYLAICKKGPAIAQQFKVINHLAARRGKNKVMHIESVKIGGLPAETDFFVEKKFADCLLVKALPKTGRTHQIRVHLSGLKMPILGDQLYGGKSSLVARMMLHACELSFIHPFEKKEVSISCQPPTDFQKILENLRQADLVSSADPK